MIQESNILGVKVHLGKRQDVLRRIKSFLNSGNQKGRLVVTLNPEMVVRAQKDAFFKKIIQSADLVTPDGIGIIKALTFLRVISKKQYRRIAGVDLVSDLINYFGEKEKFFLFGARQHVLKRAIVNLKKRNPRLRIVGAMPGYGYHNLEVIREINQQQPSILLVALGSPKQEKWLYLFLSQLSSVKVGIGIGGTFDFIAQNIKRAPPCWRNLGLEWLWRFIVQPWRIVRIYKAVLVFSLLVFKLRLRQKKL